MIFECKNLCLSLKNTNIHHKLKYYKALSNISVSVSTGEILAVMGPSGSGKTHLLKTLACRVPSTGKTNGDLLIDDDVISYDDWVDKAYYVNDIDFYYDKIVVDDFIKQCARLKMPMNSLKNINERVNYLQSRLHLHECSGKIFSELTIGEKKRTMILCALMSEAKIIFIDECTSEMDASTAFDVVNLLKEFAGREEKIIAITIEQPNQLIFDKIDKIVLLDVGKMVYSGPTSEVENKLKESGLERRDNETLPDFIIDIFRKEIGYEETSKYHQQIQDLIKENNKEEYIQKNEKRKNNGKVSFKPNFEHLKMLISRRFYAHYESNLKYVLKFILKFLVYSGVLILIFKFTDDKTKTAIDNIPNAANFTEEIKKDNDVIQAAVNYQKIPLLLCIPAVVAFFCIYSLISAFYSEKEIIMKELSLGTYSITTYFLSVYVYEMLTHLFPLFLIMTGVFFSFLHLINFWVVLIPFTSLLFLVPLILFYASLTFNSRRLFLLGTLVTILTVVPPLFIIEKLYTNGGISNMSIRILTSIYFLIPYHFHVSAYVYRACTGIENKLASKNYEQLADFKKAIQDKKDMTLSIAGNFKINALLTGLMVLASYFITLLLTIFILSIKLKPEIRTVMSNGRKPKKKEEKKAETLLEDEPKNDGDKKSQKSNKVNGFDKETLYEKLDEGEKSPI